jgi:colanic acid/amylovoran biosynthesis glycosyltransferase
LPTTQSLAVAPSPRVAYLVNQYPGISHTFIRREILALEAAGTSVARFSLRGWGDPLTDPADQAERLRTRYVLKEGLSGLLQGVLRASVRNPPGAWAAWKAMWAMRQGHDRSLLYYLAYWAEGAVLANWLTEADIGHLHAHFGTNSAAVALLASRFSGIGYSFTVHGPEEFDRPQAISLPLKIAHARFVVGISSFGRSQLFRWTERADWPKVQVVHCGLEAGFAASASAQRLRARPPIDFVCVGRICEQKGQLLLVEALAQLRDAGHCAHLVLAGDGPMREQIEARARELRVSDQIRITGWISSAQVRDELLGARCMVLPSFAEGLPVVIMEAMAVHRPVISTYVAGIPELVQPGQTGWLVPAGDVAQLALAMRHSCEQSDKDWVQMGERAAQRVQQRHAIATEAAKLQTLFDAALPAPPPAPAPTGTTRLRHVD